MTSFQETWIANRRLTILRLLFEVGGEPSENVIYKGIVHAGFSNASREDVRGDLDHLKEVGCLKEDWLDGRLRVISLTERGEDAAFGRGAPVAGVEHSRWRR